MSRAEDKVDLAYQLGLLMRPLLDVADEGERASSAMRSRAAAKFSHGKGPFVKSVSEFARGEMGHTYQVEQSAVELALARLQNDLPSKLDLPEELRPFVEAHGRTARAAIARIPVPMEQSTLEAGRPFAAYCFLRDLCSSAVHHVTFVDRYVDASIFYRYIRGVSDEIKVRVITWPEEQLKSSSDKQRFAAFLDVSRLFAEERGTENYSLIVQRTIHDRFLQCDEVVYALGGSFKDAGFKDPMTVSKVCEGAEADEWIHGLLDDSIELYGASSHSHP